MKLFSLGPTLSLKGRKFMGPGGWWGYPCDRPLTDIRMMAASSGPNTDR